jgi:predicted nuclease with TOPRIM domain
VSNPEDRTKKRNRAVPAFDALEEAVNVAAAQLKELRGGLVRAQEEGREMRELLRKFTAGEADPAHLMSRLGELESENQELLDRMKTGKEGVDRLLARIRFLEEQG